MTKTRGFVSCILRNHGYLESEDHKNEFYFQTSAVMLPVDGSSMSLEVGDEVQFLLRTTGEKSIADNISLLERKTIQSMVCTVDFLKVDEYSEDRYLVQKSFFTLCFGFDF